MYNVRTVNCSSSEHDPAHQASLRNKQEESKKVSAIGGWINLSIIAGSVGKCGKLRSIRVLREHFSLKYLKRKVKNSPKTAKVSNQSAIKFTK